MVEDDADGVNINVLANDIDADNTDGDTAVTDTLTVSSWTDPAHGSVTKNADGTLKYTPDANYYGADSFEYTVSDGRGGLDTGTVQINVTSVNDAPVAKNDNGPYTVTTSGPVQHRTYTVTGNVLTNDTDADNTDFDTAKNDTLKVSSSTPVQSTPAGTTFKLNDDGTFELKTRNPGTYTCTYVTSDGTRTSGTGTVTIVVTSA